MHRVLCPMCDSQGFIPKGAIGRQVKCANKECMVPVFTAGADQADAPGRAPSRVSDDAVAADVKVSTEGSKKNPVVMYAIVGTVALAATFGVVKFFNSMGTDSLPPLAPIANSNGGNGSNVTEDPVEDPGPAANVEQTEPEAIPEYRKRATELALEMIDQSRVTSGNRDKAYCRRMTGDAYLRLGMLDKANVEFAAMEKLATDRRRQTGYYKIVPLVDQYWRLVHAGESGTAVSVLEEASALRTSMPSSGDIALESGVMLAAAVAHGGDLKLASEIVKYQSVDRTVISQVDTLRLAAWSVMAHTMDDLGRPAPSPFAVYSWQRAVVTAIAAQLAAHGQWDAAIAWTNQIDEDRTAAESLSVIAAEMATQNDLSAAEKLVAAATAKGDDALLRVNSTLGWASESHWEDAQTAMAQRTTPKLAAVPGIEGTTNASAPDISGSMARAGALADFVTAATRNNNPEAAANGMKLLFATASDTVAPTVLIRNLAREISEDGDNVKKRVAEELRLNDSEIRPRFIAYRRGIDRLQKASEKRHRTLLSLLTRIIDGGGLDAIQTAYATDEAWTQEIAIDDFRAVLFAAAAANGQPFPEILKQKRDLLVPLHRADPADEISIVALQIGAWQGFLAGNLTPARALETAPRLQGLCTASLRFIARGLALKVDEPGPLVDEILLIKNGVYREKCLASTMRISTLRGEMSKSIGAINRLVKLPTQKVVSLHGIVVGALTLDETSTDENEER